MGGEVVASRDLPSFPTPGSMAWVDITCKAGEEVVP